jgi:hypothetical protein
VWTVLISCDETSSTRSGTRVAVRLPSCLPPTELGCRQNGSESSHLPRALPLPCQTAAPSFLSPAAVLILSSRGQGQTMCQTRSDPAGARDLGIRTDLLWLCVHTAETYGATTPRKDNDEDPRHREPQGEGEHHHVQGESAAAAAAAAARRCRRFHRPRASS